jgi:hypothetical protein
MDHHIASFPPARRMRACFEDGLKAAFPPCHDPLPVEIDELLQRLDKPLR